MFTSLNFTFILEPDIIRSNWILDVVLALVGRFTCRSSVKVMVHELFVLFLPPHLRHPRIKLCWYPSLGYHHRIFVGSPYHRVVHSLIVMVPIFQAFFNRFIISLTFASYDL